LWCKSFPPFSIAEDAIKYIRIAIQDIYKLIDKDCPRWVEADHVGGWPGVDRPVSALAPAFFSLGGSQSDLSSSLSVKYPV
jgi:hypothetical protein